MNGASLLAFGIIHLGFGDGPRPRPADRADVLALSIVAAPQRRLKFGEPVHLRLNVSNANPTPSDITVTNPINMFEFEVIRPDGRPARKTAYGERKIEVALWGIGSRYRVGVDPADPQEFEVDDFNRLFDMSLAGKYQIRAVYRYRQPPMASNTVVVEIAEPEPRRRTIGTDPGEE